MAESMATNIVGTITQVIGAVVDVRFEGELPSILNALHCDNAGQKLVLELHVDDGTDDLGDLSDCVGRGHGVLF